jgi:hypothetical protein
VLLDDQVAAQRDHHQHTEHPAGERDHRRQADLERVAEEDQRGDAEHNGRGDGFAGGASGLDDVVLEDRALVALAPDRPDRQHRDRNGGGSRQSDAQREVRRRRAEDDAEHRAERERAERELGRVLLRRDDGPEGLGGAAQAKTPSTCRVAITSSPREAPVRSDPRPCSEE